MKHKKIALAFLGLVILGVGTIFAFTGGHEGHRGGFGFGRGGFPPPFIFEKISKELGLNEEQKTQAKQILEDSKTQIEPLVSSMKINREQIKDLGTDGNFDEAKVNQIASEQAETMKNLFVEKERTKAQLFALLTPEQREKAKQMQDKFGEKMKGKFRHGFGEKPAPTE